MTHHGSLRGLAATFLYGAAALLWVVGEAAADEAKPSSALADEWSMSISPYAWAAGLDGKVAPFPGAPEADVDASFSDILDDLDLGAMAIVELRYKRFAGYMDLVYTEISADQDTPLGRRHDDVELENEVFIGTFGGAYRPIETDHASLDLLVGIRAWSVDTDLDLEGGRRPDEEFEHNENWVDPMIGLHGRYQFENGIFLTNLMQIGGFGVGSDLTWDVFGAVGYQFNDSISAIAGYRHLDVDYKHNGFVFDVDLSGPVIGMTITF
jgi:hypothetical protein